MTKPLMVLPEFTDLSAKCARSTVITDSGFVLMEEAMHPGCFIKI